MLAARQAACAHAARAASERAMVAPPGRGMMRHLSVSKDAASSPYLATSGTGYALAAPAVLAASCA